MTSTQLTDGLRIEVLALKRGLDFALLLHSLNIISLGRLCMLDGHSLHWPAKSNPYMIGPDGQRIDFQVDKFVPFISAAQIGKPVTLPSK